MTTCPTATVTALLGGAVCVAGATPPPAAHAAALSQPPLIMRLSKDEFRIAFGVTAPGCAASGCSGVIRYRVAWKTEDGAMIFEFKRIGYSIAPHASRTITVDRQYFDTAEGAHATEVVNVSVERITCTHGAQPVSAQLAALSRP